MGEQADMATDATIRRAGDADLAVLADNFRKMWLEIGWSPEALREDWVDVVDSFVEAARSESDFAAFVAEIDGEVVATAACQILSGLYPEIRLGSSHLAGYIWGVYVRPDHRRLGLAWTILAGSDVRASSSTPLGTASASIGRWGSATRTSSTSCWPDRVRRATRADHDTFPGSSGCREAHRRLKVSVL
jgi:GNAT superfamily N-acetyltransferase